MRLSEWRKAAPTPDSMSNQVLAVLHPVLADLGADPDPECWVAWGDDPALRYSVFAPTPVGLVTAGVRLSGPDEGPRVTAKLVRWSKLSVSELGVDSSGGHRLVAVQLEGQVLKGMDEESDRICEFVRGLIAAIDNRVPQTIPLALVQAAPRVTGAAEPVAISAAPVATIGPKSKAPARAKPKAAAPKAIPAAVATSSGPTEPAAPPALSKPIAARASTRRPGSRPAERAGADAASSPTAPSAPAESPAGRAPVEPEPDRSEWIGPHPIEEAPKREPNRPRPWIP